MLHVCLTREAMDAAHGRCRPPPEQVYSLFLATHLVAIGFADENWDH